MEEEAEKYYIIRGLKENRAIEIQLQSCSNIEELKEKMKLLDIQENQNQRPTLYPRNQRFPQRPTVLRPNAPTFYPVKEHKTIIRYSNLIKHENL
ncbi:hypothetical protein TNCV_4100321 [Trichonephila clavipes]|nr:hypothetical protein TNCV_4100321 [Trichonephila clavipes]